MTENYPITPPPELVQEWLEELNTSAPQDVLLAVVQWGADQELEASCEWLGASDRIFDFSDITTLGSGYRAYFHSDIAELLRAARRPRPPSLKKQAIADFKWLIGRTVGNPEADTRSKRILQALESLSDD